MAQAEFIKVQKSLDALQGIPDREYDGPNEVSKAVSK
jgi:hypothetical protein